MRSLRCAAQHMAFSSVTGAYMGESGRFDAFETLLAVLAARARHPDTPPERLRQADPVLDAFMDCREGPDGGGAALVREDVKVDVGRGPPLGREVRRPEGKAVTAGQTAPQLIVQHQRKALALRAGATAASAERHSVSEALLGSVGQQGAARHGPAGERRSLLGAKGNHDHKPRQRHRPAVAQKPSGMAAASMHNATAIIRPRRVCSVSPFDTEDPAAFPCRSLVKGIYSPPPGGLICAGVGSVSQCPRLWS